MRLRNSAKGVIVQDGRVLLTRCVDGTGEWHCCPGGGQEPGETLEQAVIRECMEETGAAVSVSNMLAVLEWYDVPNDIHTIEFYFACALQGGEIGNGHTPDDVQVGVEWIDPREFKRIDLRPSQLVPVIHELEGFKYLGEVSGRLKRVPAPPQP